MDFPQLWLRLPEIVNATAITTVLLFLCSGLGLLVVRPSSALDEQRLVGAQYLVGFLGYTALLALAAQLGLPYLAAVICFTALALLGLGAIVWTTRANSRQLEWRLLVAAILGVATFIAGAARAAAGYLDAYHYAYGAARLFIDDWARQYAAALTAAPALDEIYNQIRFTRAPVEALLWPLAALGEGVTVYDVHRVAMWLLVLAGVLLFDALHGLAPAPVRAVLVIGSIGVFNVRAASYAGHINQLTALFIALAMLWLWRWIDAPRLRGPLLLTCGFLIASTYPEFLLAMPLYLLCAVVLFPRPFRALVVDGAWFAAGALVTLATTRGYLSWYLQIQTTAVPGLHLIAARPDNPGNTWLALLVQEAPLLWPLLALLPVAIWLWRWPPPSVLPPNRLVWPALAAGLGLVVLWTWVILRNPVPHYAAWKIGGWVGPGLFVLTWALLQYLPRRPRLVLLGGLLALLLARAAFLPNGLLVAHPYTWNAEILAPRRLNGERTPCVTEFASTHYLLVLRSIAESAAPTRHCTIAISPAQAAASAFEGLPPRRWQAGVPQTYTLQVFNASEQPWLAEGPSRASLAVRFVTPGDREGPYQGSVPLNPINAAALGPVTVTIAPPSTPGTYLLEHRVVLDQPVWSEQALVLPVQVEPAP